MKFIVISFFAVLILFLALFIGKTTIINGQVYIERPITALLFIFIIIAGYFNL